MPLAREQRKLAAIVAADVVGYSRLMGRDESGTLARLRKNRVERLDPVLAKYGGRLVNLTGDGAQEVFAADKFLDSDLGNTLHIGVPPENPGQGARGGFAPAAASVVRGYTGTQIFNTAGTATGPGPRPRRRRGLRVLRRSQLLPAAPPHAPRPGDCRPPARAG